MAATTVFRAVCARPRSIDLARNSLFAVSVAAGCLSLTPRSVSAQLALTPPGAPLVLLAADRVGGPAELPDAPDALNMSVSPAVAATPFSSSKSMERVGTGADTVNGSKTAGRYTKYIEPGESVSRLTVRDKAILGLKDAVSPFSLVAWLTSSGYEQATNNSPNYGQTGQGYAQRLGAAAVRDFTEGTFADSVLSPLLHEDPRFYRMGKGHPFLKRLVYAGTRGLITRTDGGHSTVNIANIGGNLGGSFLTDAYYPDRNTSLSETMETFGTSVGGSALGFAVSEFLPDVFHAFHLPAPGY